MSNKFDNNKLAMITNRIVPSKFSNPKQMDPDVFLENMIDYINAVGCDETKSLLFFKMSLE